MPLRVSVEEFTRLFGLAVPAKAKGPRAAKPKAKRIPRAAADPATILRPTSTGNMKLQREQALSVALFHRLLELRAQGRLRCTFSAVPAELGVPTFTAEAKRMSTMVSMKRAAMGTISGVPDWVFLGRSAATWCELKAPSPGSTFRKVPRKAGPALRSVKTPAGRLSPAQEAFQEWAITVGANHAVCTSVDEVIAHLVTLGLVSET
jgi:hypothetical protein